MAGGLLLQATCVATGPPWLLAVVNTVVLCLLCRLMGIADAKKTCPHLVLVSHRPSHMLGLLYWVECCMAL